MIQFEAENAALSSMNTYLQTAFGRFRCVRVHVHVHVLEREREREREQESLMMSPHSYVCYFFSSESFSFERQLLILLERSLALMSTLKSRG